MTPGPRPAVNLPGVGADGAAAPAASDTEQKIESMPPWAKLTRAPRSLISLAVMGLVIVRAVDVVA